MSNSGLVTTRHVADRLGVTPRQVARLVERGELTPVVKAPGPTGAFMFNADEVDDLVERTARRLQERLEQMKAAS